MLRAFRHARPRRYMAICNEVKSQNAEADVLPLLAIGAVSVGAVGTWFYTRENKDETSIKSRLSCREMVYLCEGNSNLLCKTRSTPYILQFKKDVDAKLVDFERQRQMQLFLSRWFSPQYISIPKILSVPASDIRSLDAHLLAARPKAVRKQRLDVGSDIRVEVLQKEDLFNPACISLEICPGCGLQEGENVPSRHCMMHCVSQHRITRDLSLQLFSASDECSAAIAAALEEAYGSFHIHFFEADGSFLGGIDQRGLEKVQATLQGVNLSTDQLTKMAGRALQPLLVPLQKLQACACGNSEKYAQQILQMFEAEGGTVEDLKDAMSNQKEIERALRKVLKQADQGAAFLLVEKQEREALKLLSSPKWKARQVEEAKGWLLRFLLARASFQAKVLLNFAQETDEMTKGSLADQRFQPELDDGWWVRVTLVGIELKIDEIEKSNAELETLIAHYKEVAAA